MKKEGALMKTLKVMLVLNAVLLACILLGTSVSAQRPAETNAEGTPYLPVNINPTPVPPMVNANPNGQPLKVDVVQMVDVRVPEIRITPAGCDFRDNYQAAVGRSINGPIVLTYLNVASQSTATLIGQGEPRRLTFTAAALASAIYLHAGQQLNFDTDVLYSGCRPQ
jgi:hypothetical protein